MGLTLFPALCMQSRLGCRQRLGWLISGVVNKILHLCIQGFTSDTEGKKHQVKAIKMSVSLKNAPLPQTFFMFLCCFLCCAHYVQDMNVY